MQCPGDQFGMEVTLGTTDMSQRLILGSAVFDGVWHYGEASISQQPLSFTSVAVQALDRCSVVKRDIYWG